MRGPGWRGGTPAGLVLGGGGRQLLHDLGLFVDEALEEVGDAALGVAEAALDEGEGAGHVLVDLRQDPELVGQEDGADELVDGLVGVGERVSAEGEGGGGV